MTYSPHLKKNVAILSIAQALYMSGTSLNVATTALVGLALASNKNLSSLPFALQLLATMLTSIPAGMLMARIGRKRSFLISTIIAISGALINTYAIIHHHFSLFLMGSIFLGVFSGFANFYRFAAADTATEEYKSRAISYVLAGGVLAAIIGPNLANLTRDLIGNANFAGSYASIIMLHVLSFIFLNFLQLPHDRASQLQSQVKGRPLCQIARQPRFIIAVISAMLGYAAMTLIMTATPLAMRHHHYDFSETAFVIQWHVLGMFAPSFVTGHLIRRFGLLAILVTGALSGIACVLINFQGTSPTHFWIALMLLGVSWNFLFIGGTTLLTDTYHEHEKFRTQALNDFLVFSVVAFASLSAGFLHNYYGWQSVNYAAIPAYAIILIALLWLFIIDKNMHVVVPDDIEQKTSI